MPDDDRQPFTPPDVPQPDFRGTEEQGDGSELANEILENRTPPSEEPPRQASEPPPPQEPPQPSYVTPQYLEERDKRLQAEKELKEWRDWRASVEAQAQPQPPPPDPYLQPVEYVNGVVQQNLQTALAPVMQVVSRMYHHNKFVEAKQQFGDELAEKAYQEFDKTVPQMPRAEFESVMQAQNPFAAAVQWMRRRDLLAAIGNDPGRLDEVIQMLSSNRQDQRSQPPPAARQEPPPPPQPQYQAPPRIEAGWVQPKAPTLPSVNRSGSANAAAPRGITDLPDEDLVEEILNAPWHNGGTPSRR
jgi:hypothetical protein